MDFLMKALECPVCLDVITDPPIYQCENTQSHSFCSTCHGSLRRDEKPCPVCRAQLAGRRSTVLENIVEGFPEKIKCKFDGCDFKKMCGDCFDAHEEECENRYVPCLYCDAKVGLKSIAQHVTNNHPGESGTGEVAFAGFSIPRQDLAVSSHQMKKMQWVYIVGQLPWSIPYDIPAFLFNLNSENNAPTIIWISCITPKKSLAKNYKYTFQLKNSEGKFLLEGTRLCVPCDLSHDEVRELGCHLVLDKETIADAKAGGRDDKLEVTITISEV